MTDHNVIKITYEDANIYVEILELFIKELIKKDPLDPAIEECKALRNRMNKAIHNHLHFK